jgi:hypothetical protein
MVDPIDPRELRWKYSSLNEEHPGGIDPVKYGVLWQRVQEMDKKIDKMESKIEELLALANRGRGGLWMGMTFISVSSAIVGYIISIFLKR